MRCRRFGNGWRWRLGQGRTNLAVELGGGIGDESEFGFEFVPDDAGDRVEGGGDQLFMVGGGAFGGIGWQAGSDDLIEADESGAEVADGACEFWE